MKNGLGVTTHELITFSELVVESQYLLKLQSDKITRKYRVLTQLNALVRCHVVSHQTHFRETNSDECVWRSGSARLMPLAAIGGGVLLLRRR